LEIARARCFKIQPSKIADAKHQVAPQTSKGQARLLQSASLVQVRVGITRRDADAVARQVAATLVLAPDRSTTSNRRLSAAASRRDRTDHADRNFSQGARSAQLCRRAGHR